MNEVVNIHGKKKGYLVEGVKITPIFVRITHPLKGTKKKDPIETKIPLIFPPRPLYFSLYFLAY